jgi:tRNA threonylcarbamoyladenosine biosynthesis protein TsaB
MAEAKIALTELNAVAVSKGPGSYTGLRIGVSAAKGLCFSLDVPLISIATLTSMASQVKGAYDCIIPVLDARRMEVYAAVFNIDLKQIRDTEAKIINEHSFVAYTENKTVHILGSGAQKIKDLLHREIKTPEYFVREFTSEVYYSCYALCMTRCGKGISIPSASNLFFISSIT